MVRGVEQVFLTSLKRDERGGDVGGGAASRVVCGLVIAESTSEYDMWCVKREVVVAVVRAALQDVLYISKPRVASYGIYFYSHSLTNQSFPRCHATGSPLPPTGLL